MISFIILLSIFLKKNEVLSIVCIVCIPPPKVDMNYYASYNSFFPPTFSSIDLKTPTKPKQVFIFWRGNFFFFPSLLVRI